jgi:hypothetical protein
VILITGYPDENILDPGRRSGRKRRGFEAASR